MSAMYPGASGAFASRAEKVAAMLNPNSGERAAAEFVKHELEVNLGREMVFDLFPVPKSPPVIEDAKEFILTMKPDLLIVAGGDGTISLALDITDTLRKDGSIGPDDVPVAILPMGTGNDLSRSLGFGGGYTKPLGDAAAKFKDLLEAMCSASPRRIDRWQLRMQTSPPTSSGLHPDTTYSQSREVDESGATVLRAVHTQPPVSPEPVVKGFMNYFSAGFDAAIASNFGEFRHKNPELCASRSMNKMWYAAYGVKAMATSDKFPSERVKVVIDGKKVKLPSSCKSIVIGNVLTYSGGAVLWKDKEQPAAVDDGKVEVMCLDGVWHMVGIGAGTAKARKLGQGSHIELVVPAHFTMQYDGEPMDQAGAADQDVTIEITHIGQSLATEMTDKAHRTLHGSESGKK